MPRLTVTRGLSASAPSCWTTVGTGQTHWAGKYEPWMFSVLKLVLFLGRTRQIHAVMNFLKAERRLKSEWAMWDRQGAGQTERCGPPEIPLMLGQPVPLYHHSGSSAARAKRLLSHLTPALKLLSSFPFCFPLPSTLFQAPEIQAQLWTNTLWFLKSYRASETGGKKNPLCALPGPWGWLEHGASLQDRWR